MMPESEAPSLDPGDPMVQNGPGATSASVIGRTTMNSPCPDPVQVAVLVPCYNEEAAIAQVVRAFREALPEANIYVYDH
jgi:hypothetical protein